jgi:hypothetical protein
MRPNEIIVPQGGRNYSDVTKTLNTSYVSGKAWMGKVINEIVTYHLWLNAQCVGNRGCDRLLPLMEWRPEVLDDKTGEAFTREATGRVVMSDWQTV